MKHFTATQNDAGVRLSRFVQGVTKDFPNSLLYKSFRNKRIKVNGKRADADTRLQAGDAIDLYINDEFFVSTCDTPLHVVTTHNETTVSPITRMPSKPQPAIHIIFEDDNLAILYKPAGVLCHSDCTGDGNLVDAFTAHLIAQGTYDPTTEHRFKPSICNRLDRGTEGLVIAAKNYTTLRDMNEIIRTDRLKKEYYTITIGTPRTGRFTAWWSHNETLRKVSIHANQDSKKTRKNIITDIDVLKSANGFSFCKIGLITGRTHQIRAHLAYLGRPVLGDIKYGNRSINQQTHTKTQALCAAKLRFFQIPEENTLSYLNGKVVKLKDPHILKQFETLMQ